MNTCFICGKEATTEEHVIPKWLQRKYDLWDQNLTLVNGTTLNYRKLKVPCCSECNNSFLSRIEIKIQAGTATDEEVWMWAVKLHYGIFKKDDFLEWDRKNPKYKIGTVVRNDDPLELDRHLVHCIHGEFKTDPSPFGSVFRFEFNNDLEYYFSHMIEPPAICINTGRIGYVVFIKDTGSLKRQKNIMDIYNMHSTNSHIGKMINFFANAWLHLYRFKISYPILLTKGFIAVLGSGIVIDEIPFDQEMFKKVFKFLNYGREVKILNNNEYEINNGNA